MRLRQSLIAGAVAALLFAASGAGAENVPAPPPSFRDAQYVHVTLGTSNTEDGLRMVDGQPDGQTEPVSEGAGRRTLPPASGEERFFYFDVHDTYISGSLNRVVMTVTYLDRGLSPIFLEYDAFDTVNPASTEAEIVKKRAPLVMRGNTESWKTARITLEDARFGGHQPGGADFRIGSTDGLIITSVSVMRSIEKPRPDIRVVLDGSEVKFDVLPYADPATGRTLVPMRLLFNALGVPDSAISWDGAARKVDALRGQTLMTLKIDSPVAYINAQPLQLDQPAVIRGNRTLVPVRFVAEQFGLQVGWNDQLRVITLTSQQAPNQTPPEPAANPAQPAPAPTNLAPDGN